MAELLLVMDFGGQYKELIARTVRGLNVYSEIKPGYITADEVRKLNPIGIILTGGPLSVYEETSHKIDPEIFNMGVPVLGICYGMQLMTYTLGGKVEPCRASEYGRIKTRTTGSSKILPKSGSEFSVLMSHTDGVSELPEGFVGTAATENCPFAAAENVERGLYCVQFHPEVEHTDGGREVVERFLFDVCGAKGDYKLDDYLETQIKNIREKVGNNGVLLALSGGVDSSVCAAILSKAIPGQLTCIFVDHGFMRLNEGDDIERIFSKRDLNFVRVNAEKRFLSKIKGVTDPERKRKIVGEEFIRVFEDESKKLTNVRFLAQGTIYPDVIETGGEMGAVIKSHHNVGGIPENLDFDGVVEPLAGLFKDEVRKLGRQLGLPSSLVDRQPFPGPGLSIRIMGAITKKKLDTLRQAEHILNTEMKSYKTKPQQYFAVLTNTRTVGVKGDGRTYDKVVAIRAVHTSDFMTCEYAPLPHALLGKISSRIANEVKGVGRVVYDITSKPPATVEWE